MMKSMLVLASLGTAPAESLRLPEHVDGPRLACALILDDAAASAVCIDVPVSPIAPLRSLRPQPRPNAEAREE